MVQTSDGKYATGGATLENGRADFIFVLFDERGTCITTRNYGGAQSDACRAIIETPDGGFALAGLTGSYGAGNYDFWFIRSDSVGEPLWSKTYGSEGLEVCNAMTQTRDGGYALAGYSDNDRDNIYDCLLVKIDSEGDSLWSRTYRGAGNEACYSIIELSDGGYALAGYTGSYGAYGYDFWLIRTNDSGDSLWSRTFGGEDFECCYSIVQTHDRGFALAGYTKTFGAGGYDYWLVRTDEAGDSLWSRTFGGSDTSICTTVRQTPDGGFALAGRTQTEERHFDNLLIRTNSEGDSLWAKVFGSMNDEGCSAMIQTQDGGYALAGYSFTSGVGVGQEDGYIVKTTPDPLSVRNPVSLLTPCTLLFAPAYPNPFNSSTTISYTLLSPGWTTMDVVDISGRLVTRLSDGWKEAGSYREVWDGRGVGSGEYFLRISSQGIAQVWPIQLVK